MIRYLSRFAFAVSFFLAACGGSDSFQPQALSINRISASWVNTSLDERYAVRSDAEWQRVWKLHGSAALPISQRPTFDFSTTMILGVTRGSGQNGCYSLSILRATEEETEIRVEYRESIPALTSICTLAIVSLTDFVSVARSEKPVTFVRVDA